jgi:hypothetical protein
MLIVSPPPCPGISTRRLTSILIALAMVLYASPGIAEFSLQEKESQLHIEEDGKAVLVYNFGPVAPPAHVNAARYTRSSYIHPLFGVDGEMLTDDFPIDHRHHRGVFWTWPETRVGDKKMDVWTLVGARQRFIKWLNKEVTDDSVEIGVENGWFFDGDSEPKVRETIRFTVHPAYGGNRAIDFRLRFTNVCTEDVTFEGAKDKGYGGFSFRPHADNKPFTFHTATGIAEEDALSYETPWASVSWQKKDSKTPTGVALFQHPSNPGFPHPGWIFRHYAFLGVCWPHEQTHVLKPGEHFELQYRLLTHRNATPEVLGALFETYTGKK